MARRRCDRSGPRKFRITGFEELESRHLLSITGLGIADSPLASTPPAALDNVPALVGQPLAAWLSTPLAEFRLVAEDLNNNRIDSIKVGQDFRLAAFVEDIRENLPPNNWQGTVIAGVWSAFMNVVYDTNLVSITAQPNEFVSNASDPGNFADLGIEFGDYFDQGLRYGDLSTPGQIVGAGAAPLRFSSSGTGSVLMWRITVHADAGGVVLFEPSVDSNPDHESSFIDPVDALTADQIQFTPLELPIIGPPSVSITPVISQTESASGVTPYVFTVSLSCASEQAVTAVVSTSDGTARSTNPHQDFTSLSTTLTFAAGETSKQVTVLVSGDTEAEADETFSVILANPTNARLGTVKTGIGTIQNDDYLTIGVGEIWPSQPEGNSQTSRVFTVTISEASSTDVLVPFHTQDGTATAANNDYVAASGTLTFLAGSSASQLVTVAVIGDTVYEPSEDFYLDLTRPAIAVFDSSYGQAIATLWNDDWSAVSTSEDNTSSVVTTESDGLLHALTIESAGANHAITSDSDVQQMPSVAVDPHDPNHVVIAYMDYALLTTGYAGIGVAVSHDGGQSWQNKDDKGQPYSVSLPQNFDQGAANPTAKFDSEGRVYISFMAATFKVGKPPLTNPNLKDGADVQFRAYGLTSNNGIFVSRSDDGGMNWQAPATVASHRYLGTQKVPFDIIPDLAIDTFHTVTTTTGEKVNPMYATFARYYPAGQYPGESDAIGGSNIIFAVSTDGGRTWQEKTESQPMESSDPVTVIFNEQKFSGREPPEGLGFENWAHVTVGPQGDIYVSQTVGGRFAVHHSIDGGTSFSHPVLDVGHSALSPFGVNDDIGPPPFLSTNPFRLQNVRAIAADPTNPGTVYVAEANEIATADGTVQDEVDVIFARSTDNGVNWQTSFQVGADAAAEDGPNVVNDDNGGQSATGVENDVVSAQVMPRLVTDAQGNVALIWYDTRRDPVNHLMDVFAAVGTPARDSQGNIQSIKFSPNFRVTDNSFDASNGKFKDARGRDNFYLGDTIGLALANNVMYAAWTDTRAGNQDVFFSRVSLDPIPEPPNDRFEPNNTPDAAVKIGPDPVFHSFLPQLTLVAGEDDWFKITPPTGQLTVSAQSSGSLANLQLELRDATGTDMIAVGGQSVKARINAGQTYLVRVHSTADVGSISGSLEYSLSFATVTEVLGEVVHLVKNGALQDGDQAYYLVQSKVAGSMTAALSVIEGFNVIPTVELSDLRNPNTVLARSGPGLPPAVVPVLAGQQLLVHVAGGDTGTFSLELSNFDQFNSNMLNHTKFFFATGSGPSEAVVGDLNDDGAPDMVVSHVGQNIVSVLLNNGDGTFQAPREFAVGALQRGGPFTLFGLPNFHRDLAIANFNPDEDNFPDLLVVNTSSSDVSLLLGNGDGTFRPQRRFDATGGPFALAVGDLNNDGNFDLVVVDSSAEPTAQGAVRLGRRDGTFQPPIFFSLPNREENRTNAVRLADVNGDGNNDLIERDFVNGSSVLLGNGDGTFGLSTKIHGENGPGLAVADLNDDGHLDVVATKTNAGQVVYALNNGVGEFPTGSTFASVGQFPVAVAVADFGSELTLADGSIVLGPADGHADLIAANNGHTLPTVSGPAEVVLMPGLVDENGKFAGFGKPIRLAAPKGPLDVKTADVNGDGVLDVVVVDPDGILVIFGKQPIIQRNDTPQTARDLGTVVHVVEPTLTIVPGHTDAYFRLTVPSEAYPGAGDQVLDFSGGFTNEEGAGLMMEVFDAGGNLLGAGDRFRVRAAQDSLLLVHIFGAKSADGVAGTGAYSLVIDTLAQVAGVEAHSFLPGQDGQPGGPTTSIVLVFQGDRLGAAVAEDASNYTVVWLGPDGLAGGDDDQTIPIGMGLSANSRALIYDAGSNVDVASGRAYPTAVRQTVTLLFGQALPVGSYRIEVSAKVTSDAFNEDELSLLTEHAGFAGHPVVAIGENLIDEGAVLSIQDLVLPAGQLGDFSVFERGTRYLTQFHNNLAALLDAQLTQFGDESSITENLLSQIVATLGPALGPIGQRLASVLVIFLDPVSPYLIDPEGRSFSYDLQKNSLTNSLPGVYANVGGNVEFIVIPNPIGTYGLSVADVPARARGGAVYLGDQISEIRVGDQVLKSQSFISFTEALRSGTSEFSFSYGSPPVGRSPGPIAPPVDTGIGAILSGLAALRNVSPQALSALSMSEVVSASVSGATASGLSPTSSPRTEPRTSGSGGSTRQANVDPLQVIGEILSDMLRGMVRRIVRGLQGGSAARADDKLDDAPVLPMWREMTRILDGILKSNGSKSSAVQQGPVIDSKKTPTNAQRNSPDQATRYRASDRLDASTSEARTSEVSWASEAEGRPTPDAHSHQRSNEPATKKDSSPGPTESSTDGDPTSGSGSNATAT